jgi:SAM-dependent methyltransferase
MMRRLQLPDAPLPDKDGRLTAAAAARNREAILGVLLPRLPRQGDVLEIASGTGQHIAALAAHRPDLSFHPSDPDPVRRVSIDAYCTGLPNVAQAGDLDACQPGWAIEAAMDMVLIVNLLHLISDGELSILLDEVRRVLAPDGLLAIYGPFLRGGQTTSDGDRAFDASLRAQDAAIGYKEIEAIQSVLTALDLSVEVVEMPANNLMILARAPMVSGL